LTEGFRFASRTRSLEPAIIGKIREAAPPGAIDFALGEPIEPDPLAAREAARRHLAEGASRYVFGPGMPELRKEIASLYPPPYDHEDCVIVTVGTAEANAVATLAFAEPGSEVLLPSLAFPPSRDLIPFCGARQTEYPVSFENHFHVVPEDVDSRIGQETSMVLLNSPSNPTGAVQPSAVLERVSEAANASNIPVVSDEIYSGLCYSPSQCVSLAEISEKGLIVNGVSKSHAMTGWRVGWLVAPRELIQKLLAVHQLLVTCPPVLSQTAACAALRDGKDHQREILTVFEKKRRLMTEGLQKIPHLRFHVPEGAFYFFVDTQAYAESGAELALRLAKKGVLVVPGEVFGAAGRGFLRLSFCAKETEITTGVERFGELLQEEL